MTRSNEDVTARSGWMPTEVAEEVFPLPRILPVRRPAQLMARALPAWVLGNASVPRCSPLAA
ncbi:hypothetical protein, partial [Streptomyces sp. NPDC003374]